jgi:hypothetical protein
MTKPLLLLCFVCPLVDAVPVGSADRLVGVQFGPDDVAIDAVDSERNRVALHSD